jgi:hypothetical protein
MRPRGDPAAAFDFDHLIESRFVSGARAPGRRLRHHGTVDDDLQHLIGLDRAGTGTYVQLGLARRKAQRVPADFSTDISSRGSC